jgi:hypothetical protein
MSSRTGEAQGLDFDLNSDGMAKRNRQSEIFQFLPMTSAQRGDS